MRSKLEDILAGSPWASCPPREIGSQRRPRPLLALRSNLAIAALAALWAAAIPWALAADSDFDRVMSALAQRKQGHVSFVEKKFISMLDAQVESSGELLYEAPDRLEKRTLKPKPETLVLQGGVISAQRGRRHYQLELRQYPQVVPFIESIRATLAGDRAALEKVFKVQFDGTFEHWTLALVPHDSKLAGTIESIHIAGEQDRIHTVEIREADGDRSLLTIGPEVPE
jgi:outer membrane lipoprotein-sorting protein